MEGGACLQPEPPRPSRANAQPCVLPSSGSRQIMFPLVTRPFSHSAPHPLHLEHRTSLPVAPRKSISLEGFSKYLPYFPLVSSSRFLTSVKSVHHADRKLSTFLFYFLIMSSSKKQVVPYLLLHCQPTALGLTQLIQAINSY